jgi:hypothetical protein
MGKRKKLEIVDSITVAQSYVVALYYGDLSGLEPDEVKPVTEMIEFIGTRTLDYKEQETSFETCEISGLKSDCVTIDIYDWTSKC